MTNPDSDKMMLTSQQEIAIDLLSAGNNITHVAEQLKVSRQTVSGWLNHHPAFQASLNLRRQEISRGSADKLRQLLMPALEVLEDELTGPNRLKAAVAIIKLAGLTAPVAGPIDPIQIEQERVAAEMERDISDKERGDRLMMRELCLAR